MNQNYALSNIKLLTTSHYYKHTNNSDAISKVDTVIQDIQVSKQVPFVNECDKNYDIKPALFNKSNLICTNNYDEEIVSVVEKENIQINKIISPIRKEKKVKIQLKKIIQYKNLNEIEISLQQYMKQYNDFENDKNNIFFDLQCSACNSNEIVQLDHLNNISMWRKQIFKNKK